MGLRHIVPILVLAIQLYAASVEALDLPKLEGNKLYEGADRDPAHPPPIECGSPKQVKGKVKNLKKPSQVLNPTVFGKLAFTNAVLSSHESPQPSLITKFKFAEIKGGKNNIKALVVDDSGENAYWLTQGGTAIDIPKVPSASEPKYVFTPDFSGCSWTVTPMNNGKLRLRHVEGNHCEDQFNKLTTEQKGGSTSYGLQYRNYGYIAKNNRLIGNVQALAYMHFAGGHWTMYVQQKTCAPATGGYVFKNNKLKQLTMLEWKTEYPNVHEVKAYTVPSS